MSKRVKLTLQPIEAMLVREALDKLYESKDDYSREHILTVMRLIDSAYAGLWNPITKRYNT